MPTENEMHFFCSAEVINQPNDRDGDHNEEIANATVRRRAWSSLVSPPTCDSEFRFSNALHPSGPPSIES
jgi:hypothetical protein